MFGTYFLSLYSFMFFFLVIYILMEINIYIYIDDGLLIVYIILIFVLCVLHLNLIIISNIYIYLSRTNISSSSFIFTHYLSWLYTISKHCFEFAWWIMKDRSSILFQLFQSCTSRKKKWQKRFTPRLNCFLIFGQNF